MRLQSWIRLQPETKGHHRQELTRATLASRQIARCLPHNIEAGIVAFVADEVCAPEGMDAFGLGSDGPRTMMLAEARPLPSPRDHPRLVWVDAKRTTFAQ